MSVLSKSFCITGGIPQMQLDPPEGGKFIPEKEPKMTDITRKLEILASLKPDDIRCKQTGVLLEFVNRYAAEALAEIKRLRAMVVTADVALMSSPPPVWPIPPNPDPYSYSSIERQWPKVFDAVRAVEVWKMGHPPHKLPPAPFIAVETHGKPIAEVVDPHGEPWGSPYAMNTENWK